MSEDGQAAPLPSPPPADEPSIISVPPSQLRQLYVVVHPDEMIANRASIASAGGLLAKYRDLTKFRLSSMVVLGYYMAGEWRFRPIQLVATCGGTFLAICSAAAINQRPVPTYFAQIIEIESDKKMNRTLARPLASGAMSRTHAIIFGASTGIIGVSALAIFVNPVATALAASNIILYTAIYTPLKKVTVLNTWVGAFVGLIPPLIGWTAYTGGRIDPPAWVIGYLLFLWQIPHFLALSYYTAEDYHAGGYKMLSAESPELAPILSLIHCYALLPVGPLAWRLGLTHWAFVPTFTAITGHMIYCAHGFHKKPSAMSGRRLFMSTLSFMTLSIAAMPVLKARRED